MSHFVLTTLDCRCLLWSKEIHPTVAAMKKRLSFLVAAMAATVAAPALAQDPGKMFMINAVNPGVVSFSGEGTATFNNSSTTSNAFSVGSSTNFGVNASAASTNDYMVDANALLSLTGQSQLQQTIGTSSSAANTMAAAEAASTAATTIAKRETQSAFGDSWATFDAMHADGNGAVSHDISVGDKTYTVTNEAQYNAAKQDFYNEKVDEAFSSVTTASTQSSSQGASADGTISGKFYTENNSQTSIAASAAATTQMASSATSAANEEWGATYAEYQTDWSTEIAKLKTAGHTVTVDGKERVDVSKGTAVAAAEAVGLKFNVETGAMLEQGSANTGNESTWYGAKEAWTNDTFTSLANTAGAGGASHSDSTADVTVQGVGSIATLNASDDSAFNVDVATRIRTALPETNGTANGSAGGNLATSSFANQANTQSASAFMQAFGPDAVTLSQNDDGTFNAEITGRFTSNFSNANVGNTDLGQ